MKWTPVALLLAACTGRPATRCQQVCHQESSCADQLDQPDVDVAECVESCDTLDHSAGGRRTVDDHVACVKDAPDCQAVLDCP